MPTTVTLGDDLVERIRREHAHRVKYGHSMCHVVDALADLLPPPVPLEILAAEPGWLRSIGDTYVVASVNGYDVSVWPDGLVGLSDHNASVLCAVDFRLDDVEAAIAFAKSLVTLLQSKES